MTQNQARAMSTVVVLAQTMPSLFNHGTKIRDAIIEEFPEAAEFIGSIPESTARDLFEYVQGGGASPDDIRQQVAVHNHIWEGQLAPNIYISPDNSLGFPIEHSVNPSANLIVFLRWIVAMTNLISSDIQDVQLSSVDDDFWQGKGGVRVSFTISNHSLAKGLRGGHLQLEKLLGSTDTEEGV